MKRDVRRRLLCDSGIAGFLENFRIAGDRPRSRGGVHGGEELRETEIGCWRLTRHGRVFEGCVAGVFPQHKGEPKARPPINRARDAGGDAMGSRWRELCRVRDRLRLYS